MVKFSTRPTLRTPRVSVPTISEWLSILKVTGQIILLPPYFENFGKRLIKLPASGSPKRKLTISAFSSITTSHMSASNGRRKGGGVIGALGSRPSST